jgi:hypothetical protein
MFTAQSTWAMSTATRALDSVPFGVLTVAVVTHGARFVGATRFWKKELPVAPSGNRCSSTGRPPMVASSGSATAR